MADVKITIDIDADTAAIDRVRAKLRALCKEVEDCSETHRKFSKDLEDLSSATKKNGDEDDKNTKKKSKAMKIADFFTKKLRSLAKFGFKYLAIEAAGALLVIGSAGILFKTGAALARGYAASLSAVSYALAAVVAGAAAFAAAQRQFQAVQFGPMYSEGAINTDNQFTAASGAMKMFVDDAELAVIGAKGLNSAFKALSAQAPVTGKTTAVFRELSNYTAGMGGDLEKGSESLAKFLAEFQKKKVMGDTVTAAGKELGPQFEKILKEAQKKGLTTYDKFAEAAMKGELGDTFAKYAGQLDAVNSTVVGRFKQAFAGIKSTFIEMGEPLLQPITEVIPRIANIIEALLLRIRGNVQEIGSGSLLEGLVNVFDKVANVIGNLVTGDLSKAGDFVGGLKNMWDAVARAFEKVQDYLRPLVPASVALWEVLKPILKALAGNFNDTVNQLSDSLVSNKDKWMTLSTSIADFVRDFGVFGAQVKDTLVNLFPRIAKFVDTLGASFIAFAKMIKAVEPFLKGLLIVFTSVLTALNLIINAIDYFFTGLSKVASVVDMIVNPVLDIVKFITFGLLDMNNIFQKTAGLIKSIVAALILATVAFGASALRNATGNGGGGLYRGVKKANNARKAAKAARLLKGGAGAGGAGAGGAGAGGGGLAAAAAPAAAVAGIVAGGVGFGMLGAKLFNKDDSIKSRLGAGATGAAGGAATGAIIGSFVPVIGNVVGAIAGGIIGGVVGFVKAGHAKKQARKAAAEIIKDYQKGMDDAIKNGDLEALQKSRTDAEIAVQKQLEKGGLSASEMKKKIKDLEKLNKQVDTYTKNAGSFKMFFGGDADKMNEALEKYGSSADAAKDSIINIFDVMRKGGTDVGASWKQLMGGFNQSILEARLGMFNEQKNTTLEMQKAVDAGQRKMLEGDTSEKTVVDFLKKSYEYALGQTGGDAVAATALLEEQLTDAYGPGGALDKVSGKVSDAAEMLRLFDSKTLIDQMISSGKLQAQGRAIETISGGKIGSGVAELQIQKLISGAGKNKGPAMAAKIDALMQSYMSGGITGGELQAALFSGDSTGIDALINKVNTEENFRRQNAYRTDANGRSGMGATASTVSPNAQNQAVLIDGVTVQVSGFIKDEGTAKMIAQEVQKVIAKYGERRGSGTVTTGTTGSGQTDTAPTQGTGTRPLNP